MDSAIRTRLIDLALRTKFALDRFRELEKRTKNVKDVKFKAEIKNIEKQLEKGLELSRKILSDDTSTDNAGKDWIKAASPRVIKLEHANAIVAPEILNAETRKAIEAFNPDDLPKESFELRDGQRVIDPALFKTMIQADIDGGPKGPRWKIGALVRDLEELARRK